MKSLNFKNQIKSALFLLVGLIAVFTSCTEKYEIEIEGDSDTTIVNITNNVYDTTINWSNPVITSKVVLNQNSAYCENGGWESEFYMDGDFLFSTPGPCINITDTIYLQHLPKISFHSEKIWLDSLCYAKKNFSEIDGEINLISIDTLCSGSDGQDGQDGMDGQDGEDGADGQDGEDGSDGKDGHSPEIEIEIVELDSLCDSIKFYVDAVFAAGFEICDGEKGEQGPKGDSDTIVVYDSVIVYDSVFVYDTISIGGERYEFRNATEEECPELGGMAIEKYIQEGETEVLDTTLVFCYPHIESVKIVKDCECKPDKKAIQVTFYNPSTGEFEVTHYCP